MSSDADVCSADFASACDQSGCACLTSAKMPAICGEDIDVPATAWNSSPWTKPSSVTGEAPARTWIPGAAMSGLMIDAAVGDGPREENTVTDGAFQGCRTILPVSTIEAVARRPAWATYARTLSATFWSMCTVGTQKLSVN